MRGLSQANVDTLLSVFAEADREIRQRPNAEIDRAYLRKLLDEAYEAIGCGRRTQPSGGEK